MPDFNGNRQFAWYISPCEQHPEGKFHRGGKPVGSWAEMLAARDHHWMHACYHSTYAFASWTEGRLNAETAKSAIIDRIYIDLDDKADPQKAVDDAAEVAWYIGPHTTQWFSGMKGIGMLIHCRPVDLIPDLKGAVLSRFVNNLIDGVCEVETIDFAVVGDLNRVHRVTNSRHQTTGLYAIPLHRRELRELAIDEIRAMAADKRTLIDPVAPSQWVTDELYRIESEILQTRLTRLHDKEQIPSKTYRFISAILQSPDADRVEIYDFVDGMETEWRKIRAKQQLDLRGSVIRGERVGATAKETWLLKAWAEFRATGRAATGSRKSEHKARVHLAKLADECGWTLSEICNIYTGADDYDPGITERMVRSCIGRR